MATRHDGRHTRSLETTLKVIQISAGREALVDDCDFEYLNHFSWHWVRPRFGHGSGYAATILTAGKPHNFRLRIFMHNMIFPKPPGLEPDHRNRNGLDNQRHNLRHITRQQQSFNRTKRVGTVSKFKGVGKDKRRDRWHAQICINGKTKILGYFDQEREAAEAYNCAASELFGDFAQLNAMEAV